MKKVSVITLTLVMLISNGVVFSAPRKRRNSGGITPTATSTTTSTNTLTPITIEELETKKEMEELEIGEIIEGQTVIGEISSNLQEKINSAKNSCSGIKKDLDLLFGLNIATTASSGLGTLASGGALVTGIMKAKTDKDIEAISKKPVSSLTLEEMKAELESIKTELEEAEKKSKTLGNVRTGLMAGSIATSATSLGTSIASSVNAKKLAEKMKECNKSIADLKTAREQFLSDIDDLDVKKLGTSASSVLMKADDIVTACKGYNNDNIKQVQNMSTASAVSSGVGTSVDIAGTITSALANSTKVRNDNSEDGVKKEKNLNLTSNIMAGVSTATSGTSTVLSAISIAKAKEDSDMAQKCEEALK